MKIRLDLDYDKFVSNYEALPSICSVTIREQDDLGIFLLADIIISKIEAQLVYNSNANLPRDAFAIGYLYGFSYEAYKEKEIIGLDPNLDDPVYFAMALLLILDEFYDSKSLLHFFKNGDLNDNKSAILSEGGKNGLFLLDVHMKLIENIRTEEDNDNLNKKILHFRNFLDKVLRTFEKKNLSGIPKKTQELWRTSYADNLDSFATGQNAGSTDWISTRTNDTGAAFSLFNYLNENRHHLDNYYSNTNRVAKSEFALGLENLLKKSYADYLERTSKNESSSDEFDKTETE